MTPACGDPRRRRLGAALGIVLLGLAACSRSGPKTSPAGLPSAGQSSAPRSTTRCAASPHTCGFPDATNTGVRAGIALTPSDGVKASRDGQVISNLRINGCIEVVASNVTIENDEVIGDAPDSFCINIANGVSNTLIEDTTIHGTNSTNNSIEYGIRDEGIRTRVLRTNLYWCTECIAGSSTDVEDSYVHDLATLSGAHYEGIYDGGGAGLTLIHNTVFNEQEQTAAIYLHPDDGTALSHVTISNNLLAGGGYTIYGGADASKPSSDIVVTDNLFSVAFYAACGRYGTLDEWTAADNTWSGNRWADGPNAGAAI
jgi:hypothetical protein